MLRLAAAPVPHEVRARAARLRRCNGAAALMESDADLFFDATFRTPI